jgi:DNA-binding transcriptional LysR family regulator
MVRKIDWESQIGRRLKLRDLHVFSTVVQRGSMAKAAQHLGVSQPSVSEVIADLEHALGVRLLDRSAQGVEPTIYGAALFKRSVVVFDELKQSIRDIEFLSDATVGEVRIACTQWLEYTLLPEIILRFSERYPRVEVFADPTGSLREFSGLRERKYDCILQNVPPSFFQESATDDLNWELLLDDTVVVAAGANSPWARRRKIDLAELVNEPWILGARDTWHHAMAAEIFRAQGLSVPQSRITTVSAPLRARLLAAGPYLSTFLGSFVRRMAADHYAVRALPVDLPASSYSAWIITLKNRTLSPVVERFLACVREAAASFARKQGGRAVRSLKPNMIAGAKKPAGAAHSRGQPEDLNSGTLAILPRKLAPSRKD